MENRVKNFDVDIAIRFRDDDPPMDVCKLSIGECDGLNTFIEWPEGSSLLVHFNER